MLQSHFRTPAMTLARALFLAALLAPAAAPLLAATVSGDVSFVTRRGQKPDPVEAVIWLQPLDRRPAVEPREQVMTTRAKVLVPHVLPLPAGSVVRFPNEDPITHNLFSVSPANPFDLGLYRRGEGKQQRFDKPGVVNVYCNVHPNMSAVVVVLDTPYWTMPDGDGEYRIDAPPGKYRLQVWHEQGGSAQRDIEVTAGGQVVGETSVRLDSSRYRTSPHANKHGRPYSRVRDY